MFNKVCLPAHASTYPGDFEPLPDRREILFQLLKGKKNKFTEPPVRILKQPDHYKIEIVAPGFSRQDLYIQTVKHHLTIAGIIPAQLPAGTW